MQTGSKELIRDINFHLILEAIINEGPISRAALANTWDLPRPPSPPSYRSFWIPAWQGRWEAPRRKKAGNPILLSLHQEAGYALAVNIETTGITIMSADLLGTGCRLRQYPVRAFDEGFFSFLLEILKNTMEALPSSRYGVVGICLGVHGVSRGNQMIFAPYYSLDADLAGG